MMQAIFWTLAHSLWQGLLLAIAGGVAIIITKRSGAALRYNILSALFSLFIAVACFTFIKQLHIASVANGMPVADLSKVHGDTVIDAFATANNNNAAAVVEKNYIEQFIGYFNEHASLVVGIWFIIMTAQCIRLLANIGYAQRIRYYKTYTPSLYWQQKLSELAERIQIKRHIALLESEIVKIPLTVGFLKPVILFPFSVLSQLPPDQVEAVFLHELAHIKRKDYLVNLLQSFAELFFFFNPGVLWISSLIRDERENCCDDIAIREINDKKEFIHALVSFQEYNLNGSKYSLAFPGRKNHLLNRVKRIITNNNKTLNNMEKISLAAGIVILGVITIAFRQTEKQEAVKIQPGAKTEQVKEMINDTVPDKPGAITFSFDGSIDGKKYKIKEINDKVVELYVEGKRIPDEKIGDYQETIEKIHLDAKKQRDELQAQNELLEKQRAEMLDQEARMNKERAEMEELREKANNDEAISKLDAEQKAMDAKMEEWNRRHAVVAYEQAEIAQKDMREQLKKQNDEMMVLTNELRKRQSELKEQIRSQQQKDAKTQNESLNKQILELENEQIQIQQQRLKINQMLLNFNQGNVLASPPILKSDGAIITGDLHSEGATVPVPPPTPQVFVSHPLTDIIDDLMDEGVITSKDNLEFMLDSKILKVNGVVQPEELHSKLKGKYIKSEKNHVKYSRRGDSISADINNGD